MIDSNIVISRANGGMHYADAVFRKHAPTINYVRYILKLINYNLFNKEPHVMCFSRGNILKINYRGSYFLLLSVEWVESFRRMNANAFEEYLINQMQQKCINFDKSSYYFRSWIKHECENNINL